MPCARGRCDRRKQDEYAAALGGVDPFRFDGDVHAEPIIGNASAQDELVSHLSSAHSGVSRFSGDIHDTYGTHTSVAMLASLESWRSFATPRCIVFLVPPAGRSAVSDARRAGGGVIIDVGADARGVTIED